MGPSVFENGSYCVLCFGTEGASRIVTFYCIRPFCIWNDSKSIGLLTWILPYLRCRVLVIKPLKSKITRRMSKTQKRKERAVGKDWLHGR